MEISKLSEIEYELQKKYLTVCLSHKRQIKFVCEHPNCQSNRYICASIICMKNHKSHNEFITTFDHYLDKVMEEQKQLFQEQKILVCNQMDDLKRLSLQITEQIEKEKAKELTRLERQFEEVSIKFQQNKQSVIEDFTLPTFDSPQVFSEQIFKSDCKCCKLKDCAKNLLKAIKNRDFNLEKLKSIVIRQENLFKIAQDYLKGEVKSVLDDLFNEYTFSYFQTTNFETDYQEGLIITSVTKLLDNVIVFSNKDTVFVYDFYIKKILKIIYLSKPVRIQKIEKINSKKVAVLLQDPYFGNFHNGQNTVYVIEVNRNNILRKKTFSMKQSKIKDIICIQNTELIVMVLTSGQLQIINLSNYKTVFTFCFSKQYFNPVTILSCTVLKNLTIKKKFFKCILSIHLSNQIFGYLDIITGLFMPQKTQKNMQLYQNNYKLSRALPIQQELQKQGEQRSQLIYQPTPQQKIASNLNNKNSVTCKVTQSQENNSSDSIVSQNKFILQIYDIQTKYIFFQTVQTGNIFQRNQHYWLYYQDYFNKKTVLPYYQHNIIYFYNFSQQQRLQSQIFLTQLQRQYPVQLNTSTTQIVQANCDCGFLQFQEKIINSASKQNDCYSSKMCGYSKIYVYKSSWNTYYFMSNRGKVQTQDKMIAKDDNLDSLKKQVKTLEKQIADQERKAAMNEKKAQKEVSKYKLDAEKEKIEKESLMKERSELEDKVRKLNIELNKSSKDKKADENQTTINNLKKEIEKLNLMKPSPEILATLEMTEAPTYQELFRNVQNLQKSNKLQEEDIEKLKKGAIDSIVEKTNEIQQKVKQIEELQQLNQSLERSLKDSDYENQQMREQLRSIQSENNKAELLEEELKQIKTTLQQKDEQLENLRQEIDKQQQKFQDQLTQEQSLKEEAIIEKEREVIKIYEEKMHEIDSQFRNNEKELLQELRQCEEKLKNAELQTQSLEEEKQSISKGQKTQSDKIELKYQQKIKELEAQMDETQSYHEKILSTTKQQYENMILQQEQSMQKQIDELNEQIETLQKHSNNQEGKSQEANETIKAKEEQIKKLHDQLIEKQEEFDAKIQEYEVQIFEINKKHKEENSQLLAEIDRLKIYEEKFHQKKQAADSFNQELKRIIRDRRSSSQFSMNSDSDETMNVKVEFEKIRSEFEKVEQLNEKYEQEIAEKNAEISALSEIITEQEKKIQDKSNLIIQKEKEIDQYKAEIESSAIKLKEKEASIENLNNQIKNATSSLTEYNDKQILELTEKSKAEISHLQETVTAKLQEIKQLNTKNTELQSQNQNLSSSVEQNKQEIEQQLKKEQNLQQQINHLKELIEQSEAQLHEKNDQLAAEKNKNKSLKEQLINEKSSQNQLSDEIASLTAQNCDMEQKIKEMTAKEQQQFEESKELRTKLANLETKVQQSEETLTKKNEALEKIKQEKKQIQSELDGLKSEVNQLRQNLEKQKSEFQEKQEQVIRLTQQLESQKSQQNEMKQNLNKQIQALQLNLSKEEAIIKQNDIDITNLKEKIAYKDEEKKQIQKKLLQNEGVDVKQIELFQSQLEEKENQINQLKDQIQDMNLEQEQAVYELKKQINALNVEIKQLNLKINSSEELFQQEKNQLQSELEYAESAAIEAKMNFAEVACDRDYYECCYKNLCKEYGISI
ncbi:hypothetical protein ABPG72_016816 [Tetrahymena utriculariae]